MFVTLDFDLSHYVVVNSIPIRLESNDDQFRLLVSGSIFNGSFSSGTRWNAIFL